MPSVLVLSTILFPWLGAVIIWLVGDRNRKALNILAVLFSAAAGIASLLVDRRIFSRYNPGDPVWRGFW